MLDAGIGETPVVAAAPVSSREGARGGRSSAFRGQRRQIPLSSTKKSTTEGMSMNHTKGTWRSRSTILKAAAFATAAGLIAMPAAAVHSWNGYHWARTTTQVAPPVVNITNSTWTPYVTTAVADWNQSTVIQSPLQQRPPATAGPASRRPARSWSATPPTAITAGSASPRSGCRAATSARARRSSTTPITPRRSTTRRRGAPP